MEEWKGGIGMGRKTKLTAVEKSVLEVLYHAHHEGIHAPTSEWIARKAGVSQADAIKALNRLAVLGMVEKPGPVFTLADVDGALREMDSNCKCDTTARVLLASILFGSGDEHKIVQLGLPQDEVREIGDRFRANGIWDVGGVSEPIDGIEFWMMCAIGEGLMTRSWSRKKSEWMYSMTDAGKARVENMLKD